jgi:hypothetical protein
LLKATLIAPLGRINERGEPIMKRMVLAMAFFGLAACGGSDPGTGTGGGGGSCDINVATVHDCVEYSAAATQGQWQQACTQTMGKWSTSGCSHTNSVGGCKVDAGNGVSSTTWYYSPGLTEATVKQACGGMYVSP